MAELDKSSKEGKETKSPGLKKVQEVEGLKTILQDLSVGDSVGKKREIEKSEIQYLLKHGLSQDEAYEYTTLGTEFDLRGLSKKQKGFIESSFQAQAYAFRKLRDRLLLNDNPQKHY